jgi:hypothetical protein
MAKRKKLKRLKGLFWIPGDSEVAYNNVDGLTIECYNDTGHKEQWEFTDLATTKKPTKADLTSEGTIPDAYPPRRIEVSIKEVI